MTTVRVAAALCALALGSMANAGLTFSFADPAGGRQLSNTANGGGAGIGRLTYSTTTPIVLIVDTGVEGSTTFTNARCEMTLNMAAAQTINQFTLASLTGTFAFYDFTGGIRTDIVTATAQNGAFVRLNQSNSLMFSSNNGLLYTAGPALTPILAGQGMTGFQDAVFTLTNMLIAGGAPLTNANGVFNSFAADASFSGSSQQVPTPGSMAILMLAAGAVLRRRR
jgi:uncharacterized protein (TIGR03382 family)